MRAALVALLVALPLGCGRADATRPGLRVVAKVNGAEIAAAEAPTPQALERAIDRELVVQQAIAERLDLDPAVAGRIEAARREVLAQAWLERLAVASPPTREEVREFYAANPALFAERRIYRLRELRVPGGGGLAEALRAEAARAADLDEVARWLRTRHVEFASRRSVRAAEEVPLAALPRLARMRPGELAVLEAGEGAVSVVQLERAEPAPLGEAQAAPLIEQFLAARRRMELAAAELKRLRESASIRYVEDFKARTR